MRVFVGGAFRNVHWSVLQFRIEHSWVCCALVCISWDFPTGTRALGKYWERERQSKKPAVWSIQTGKGRASYGSIIRSGPPGFTRVAAILAAMAQETRRSFVGPNPSRRFGSASDMSRCVNENILNTTDLQDKFRQKSRYFLKSLLYI